MSFQQFDQGIPTAKINYLIDKRQREERVQQEVQRDLEQAEALEIMRFICAGETLMANHPELFERTTPAGGYISLDKLKK